MISELALAIQLSVGIVFLLSSLSKLRHPHRFVRSAVAYAVLPTRMTRALALALIPVEAFLAVAFLTGWMVVVALPLAAATLLVFLVAVGINLRRGRRIPCGCFGQASEPISFRTIIRLLMLLGAIGLLATMQNSGFLPFPAPRLVTVALPSMYLAMLLMLLGMWLLMLPHLIRLVHLLRRHYTNTDLHRYPSDSAILAQLTASADRVDRR